MKSLSENCKTEKFDQKLLDWSLKHNRLMYKDEYKGCGIYQVPCGNDCSRVITLGDDVVVAYDKKGQVRGVFCSEQCQRQHLVTVMVRRKRAKMRLMAEKALGE